MKFIEIFFHDLYSSVSWFFLNLKFPDFFLNALILLKAFILEQEHIFIYQVIKLFIKFPDHGSHFFVDFVDFYLAQ